LFSSWVDAQHVTGWAHPAKPVLRYGLIISCYDRGGCSGRCGNLFFQQRFNGIEQCMDAE
jgi:hypothetical protein